MQTVETERTTRTARALCALAALLALSAITACGDITVAGAGDAQPGPDSAVGDGGFHDAGGGPDVVAPDVADDVPTPVDLVTPDAVPGDAHIPDGAAPDVAADVPAPPDAGDTVEPDDVTAPDATMPDATGPDVMAPDVTSPDTVDLLYCVESTLDPAYGSELATPLTLEGTDELEGSCGGGGSKEFAYRWVVPFTDWFAIDTSGSDFDTVLYVKRAHCDGPEVACNNDVAATVSHSRIVRRFEAGNEFIIVVDGNGGSRGNAVLNVNVVDCPTGDVGDGVDLPQVFGMTGTENVNGGACGGDDLLERSFRFTAPFDGLWRLSATPTTDSDLKLGLYLEDGAMCGGDLLQCNGHDNGSIGMPSEVSRALTAGETVTVIVDTRSGEGAFELAATRMAAECPATDLANIGEEGLSIREQSDTMTSSCGENADIEWGQFRPYADLIVTFDDLEPNASGFCMLQVDAGFPFALSAMEGVCAGQELHCERSTLETGPDGDTNTVRYSFPKTGGKVTLVISPTAPEWSGAWSSEMVTFHPMCAM